MKQRTLIYCLIGSVALNLFLAGVSSVHLFSGKGGERGLQRERGLSGAPEDGRGPKFLRELVRAAGGPRDPRVRELWSGHRQHLHAVRREIAASNVRVLEALEQEPFNRQQLGSALKEALEARRRADELASEGAMQLVDKLSPEERRRVSHVLKDDENRRRGRRAPQ